MSGWLRKPMRVSVAGVIVNWFRLLAAELVDWTGTHTLGRQ